jgi:hypothetical protein
MLHLRMVLTHLNNMHHPAAAARKQALPDGAGCPSRRAWIRYTAKKESHHQSRGCAARISA